MLREIISHRGNRLNDELVLIANENTKGSGGACTEYIIRLPNVSDLKIKFQQGPVQEAGVNGISNEVLLAILMDRLWGFQQGRFASGENASALFHVQAVMQVLHSRTKERESRGVEGTLNP